MEKYIADQTVHIQKEIYQPDSGYRFSEDPFILAGHINPKRGERILDIGTGCGIMPLILAYKCADLNITGVEIQKELCQFAVRNVEHHGFMDKIRISHKDIANFQEGVQGDLYDIALSNPPYKKKGHGRLNPDKQKAMARHEISLTIEGVFKAAQRLLTNHGRLFTIFPAERIDDLFLAMKKHHFNALFIRFVHTRKEAPAKRVILNSVKNLKVSCSVLPPLYIHETPSCVLHSEPPYFRQ